MWVSLVDQMCYLASEDCGISTVITCRALTGTEYLSILCGCSCNQQCIHSYEKSWIGWFEEGGKE